MSKGYSISVGEYGRVVAFVSQLTRNKLTTNDTKTKLEPTRKKKLPFPIHNHKPITIIPLNICWVECDHCGVVFLVALVA